MYELNELSVHVFQNYDVICERHMPEKIVLLDNYFTFSTKEIWLNLYSPIQLVLQDNRDLYTFVVTDNL